MSGSSHPAESSGTVPRQGQAGAPEISIVIPVFNEELIVTSSVEDLTARLDHLGVDYEILLAENGSRDRTPELVRELSAALTRVRALHYPEPNYGAALRRGIGEARGRFVVCEEIDLCDVDFQRRALDALRAGGCDFVVGSKAARGAKDERPLLRRLATRVMSLLLRICVGFRGTDTHGLKAFVRERTQPVVDACIVDRDVFASELVVRAQRSGLRVVEIPIHVRERRKPSVNLFRRVPSVLRHLWRLSRIFGGPFGLLAAPERAPVAAPAAKGTGAADDAGPRPTR